MQKKRVITVILLIGILCIGAVMRLWNLGAIPPGLYIDEAANGANAIQTMETGERQVFYFDNYGREGLHINLVSVVFSVLGVGVWQLRFVGAVAGMLTILGTYFLARQFFIRNIALLSSFFVAISFWHIMFCRIAYRGILVPCVLVWAFYFLFRGLREKSYKIACVYFILFGAVFGLGLYSYIAYRAAIVLVVVLALMEWKASRKKGKKEAPRAMRWWAWMVSLCTIAVMSIPLLSVAIRRPLDFFGRAMNVSIFDTPNPLLTSVSSFVKTLGMFHITGESQWLYNVSGEPQLLLFVGIAFLVGLVVLLSRNCSELFRKDAVHAHWFLLLWLFIMLTPAMLSAEEIPNALRSSGVIPAVYIISALGAVVIYRSMLQWSTHKWKHAPTVLFIGAALVLCVLTGMQWNKYFYEWGAHSEVKYSYLNHHVELANEIQSLPEYHSKHIVVDLPGGAWMEGMSSNVQSLKFMIYGTKNVYYYTEEEAEDVIFPDEEYVVSLKEYEIEYRDSIGKEF